MIMHSIVRVRLGRNPIVSNHRLFRFFNLCNLRFKILYSTAPFFVKKNEPLLSGSQTYDMF